MPHAVVSGSVTTLAASVSAKLRERWDAGRTLLPEYLDAVLAPNSNHTQALFLFPRSTKESFIDAADRLRTELAEEGEVVLLRGQSEDASQAMLMAVPVRSSDSKHAYLMPYVSVHSRVNAWWLTNAWRSLDLSRSTWSLGDQYQVISAAACARSLIETAAALWCDARKLAELWTKIKTRGGTASTAWEDYRELLGWLMTTGYGGKFNDRLPGLAAAWKDLARSNVLGDIERLAKALPNVDLQLHYQWLCNTVHPSCGGTFAYSTPIMGHTTNLFGYVWYSPEPMRIETFGEHEDVAAERTVQSAIVVCADIGVRVIRATLADALKIIDDIGLTTKAYRHAAFQYWRPLTVTHPKQMCPCGSGEMVKECRHRWGDTGPNVGAPSIDVAEPPDN